MPVIGVVRSGPKRGDPFVATFSRSMSGLGWEEGRTFQLVALFADRQDERIPVLVGEKAAPTLGVELVMFRVKNRGEITPALDAMAAARVGAVNVLASPLLNGARQVIIERLRQTRLPAIYQWAEAAEDGGFLAYGPRISLAFRHVAGLVDKIMRGARPADLPIEQPSRFELVVNLKTAKALGVAIPKALLLRADQVIQ